MATTLGIQDKCANNSDIEWQQIDWQKTLKLANFHGLSCWLAEYLKDSPQVPEEITTRLQQIKRNQCLSYIFVEQQKCLLVETLTKAGIRFAILKGVAIAKPLYQHRWYYRPILDLDILIDPVQLEQAFALIKSLDYIDVSKSPLGATEFKQIALHHKSMALNEHSLIHPSRLLSLDIHWKLRRNILLPINCHELLNGVEKDDTGIPRLNTAHEFIFMCVNNMNDGWIKAKTVVDTYYYAEKITDWNAINHCAQQLGLQHIVNCSLAICDFFFDTCYAPKQLNKKELTLLAFVLNGYARGNELPAKHSYLDNRNLLNFIKTTAVWWSALSSESALKKDILIELLKPSSEDFDRSTSPSNTHISYLVIKRMQRLLKTYYLDKR